MKEVWQMCLKPLLIGILMILAALPLFVLMIVIGIPWAIGR